MTAKEADLEVLDEVMSDLSVKVLQNQNAGNKKMEKAYTRLWNRLQKVYIRTDAALNKVAGNA